LARILENYSLNILKNAGISVVQFNVASSPQEVSEYALKLGCPVVVKALVPVGKRGKAGAVKFASGAEDAMEAARLLIGTEVRGYPVNRVLVAEQIQATTEIYVSISIDQRSVRPVIVVSLSGGVDIEEVANTTPEKIVTRFLDPLQELVPHQCLEIMAQAGLRGRELVKVAEVLRKLYQVFNNCDATLLEINPLFISADGKVIVPACMLSVDDSALYRHKD